MLEPRRPQWRRQGGDLGLGRRTPVQLLLPPLEMEHVPKELCRGGPAQWVLASVTSVMRLVLECEQKLETRTSYP